MNNQQVTINQPIMVPIEAIHPNEWNPNEESPHQFNELVKEIQEDGFDQPLQGVRFPEHPNYSEETPQYKIIGGEHRWKAGKALGLTHLPIVVYDWNEQTQKIKTVRRNLIHGEQNSEKFTKLIRSMDDEQGEIYRRMGFETEQEMAKLVKEEIQLKDQSWLDNLTAEANKETEAVESISEVLNTIFRSSGETLDKGYMFFSYKGQMHLMTLMDSDLFAMTQRMVSTLREEGMNINEFMNSAISDKLKQLGVDISNVPAEISEEIASVNEIPLEVLQETEVATPVEQPRQKRQKMVKDIK